MKKQFVTELILVPPVDIMRCEQTIKLHVPLRLIEQTSEVTHRHFENLGRNIQLEDGQMLKVVDA